MSVQMDRMLNTYNGATDAVATLQPAAGPIFDAHRRIFFARLKLAIKSLAHGAIRPHFKLSDAIDHKEGNVAGMKHFLNKPHIGPPWDGSLFCLASLSHQRRNVKREGITLRQNGTWLLIFCTFNSLGW